MEENTVKAKENEREAKSCVISGDVSKFNMRHLFSFEKSDFISK